MSITKETLEQHLKDPAIFCCRRQKGLVISEADLEDPSLFDDMEEAGLLKLSDEGLTIEQVLGASLVRDVEALTPITEDMLDKVNEISETPAENAEEAAPEEAESVQPGTAPKVRAVTGGNGMIHIEIGKAEKLENLSMDIPVFTGAGMAEPIPVSAAAEETEEKKAGEKKVIRTLVKKHIRITDAEIGNGDIDQRREDHHRRKYCGEGAQRGSAVQKDGTLCYQAG